MKTSKLHEDFYKWMVAGEEFFKGQEDIPEEYKKTVKAVVQKCKYNLQNPDDLMDFVGDEQDCFAAAAFVYANRIVKESSVEELFEILKDIV